MARHRSVASTATRIVAAGGLSLLLTALTACSGAPVTPDEPQRVSADTSGRATAEAAGQRAASTGPGFESDDTHRWIYATNTSDSDQASDATDDEDSPESKTTDDDNQSEGESAETARTTRVHLILQANGTIQSTSGTFDDPEPAARHATDALERQSSSDNEIAGTVTLHVASDAPTDALNRLVTNLRTAGAPHVTLTFAPADNPTENSSTPAQN